MLTRLSNELIVVAFALMPLITLGFQVERIDHEILIDWKQLQFILVGVDCRGDGSQQFVDV